jgi:hypothetical protein
MSGPKEQTMSPQDDHARTRRHGVRQGVGIGDREDWIRLGQLMRRRRGQLGYQYRNRFAADRARLLGQPALSVKNMIEIEEPPPARRPGSWMQETLERIALFYDTTFDSMMAVVRGEASHLDAPEAGPGPGPMTDHARRQAAWPNAMRIWQDMSDYQQAHPRTEREDIPGAALFGKGSWYASTWDDPLLRESFTFEERIWLIADAQARQESRQRGQTRTDQSA